MTQVLVAGVMWALVVSLLILRRGRADRSITYAAVMIALAMTLNVDPVYEVTDPLLGGTNIVTLIGDALLMIGLYFLGHGVMKAGDYRPRLIRLAVGRPALCVALALVLALFLSINSGATTTTFMHDIGDQLQAFFYSVTVFTYCGVVMAAMHALAISQWTATRGLMRVPAVCLTLGSASGIVLCISVWVMDIAHVTGATSVLEAASAWYGPLTLASFLLLCAGFVAQPLARILRRQSHGVKTDALLAQLEPMWHTATKLRPGLSNQQHSNGLSTDPESQLHRHVVEIRDAMIDPRIDYVINDYQLAILERAEQHLLGAPLAKRNDGTTA
ncbi:DUF6545 domain-containing protein [Leucobacter manosquensis]|uniref:DUF6545 domain-containing protein n=1 Tax=Leucobacter manosquensis TaxID=2810611 RepID=A0ABS5M1A3_9MICO|nr:DUF6545 domain-containing protein [Leucobacter manosquensis]MBS3180974.1 hypothetical protein [Leucobacter manosquensis]